MLRLLFCSVIGFLSLTAVAAPLSDEACEQLLTQAETKPDARIYDDCGFGNEKKAWQQWAPFASAHDMKRALFELCRRYPNHPYGPMYCEKAIKLNYGPALIQRGEQYLKEKKFQQALNDFNQALKSDDLSADEIRELTEELGVLYLTPGTDVYAPKSGIALMTKIAGESSAVANNVLGYLHFSGQADVPKDSQKALLYLWRSILLGCPAAEENLGVFHLARQKKIKQDDAEYYMSLQAFTCTPFDKDAVSADLDVQGCDCPHIIKEEKQYRAQPYILIDSINDKVAVLADLNGKEHVVSKGQALPDGSIVQDVQKRLVTLFRNNKKVFLNRYHEGPCIEQCLERVMVKSKRLPIKIKPYRLTFTREECENIAYYAKQLVDVNAPYVGKTECSESGLDETTRLLLKK